MRPGIFDPLGGVHRVLGDPPRPFSIARPGQCTRHPRQSLRTNPGILDPPDHIFSNKKKRCGHMNIPIQIINILKRKE